MFLRLKPLIFFIILKKEIKLWFFFKASWYVLLNPWVSRAWVMTLIHFYLIGFFFPVMKKCSSPESHDLPRHPVLSRTRVPLVTVPTAPGPLPGGCVEPVVGPVHSRPEDPSETTFCQASREVTPGAVTRLHGTPAKSKWLKYQNTAQGGLPTPSGAQPSTSAGFAGAVCGVCCGAAGGGLCTVEDSRLGADSSRLRVLSCALRGQQPGAGRQDCVCRDKTLSLSSKTTSETEEVQSVSGGAAFCSRSVTHSQVRRRSRSRRTFSGSCCVNDLTLRADGFLTLNFP